MRETREGASRPPWSSSYFAMLCWTNYVYTDWRTMTMWKRRFLSKLLLCLEIFMLFLDGDVEETDE